jgi:hypothetical protein
MTGSQTMKQVTEFLRWVVWTVVAAAFFASALTWDRVISDWAYYTFGEVVGLALSTLFFGALLWGTIRRWRGEFIWRSALMLVIALVIVIASRTSIGRWLFSLNLFQFLVLAVAVAILSLPISNLMDRLWVRRYYGRSSRGRDHRNQSSPRGGDAQRSQGGSPRPQFQQRRLPPPR